MRMIASSTNPTPCDVRTDHDGSPAVSLAAAACGTRLAGDVPRPGRMKVARFRAAASGWRSIVVSKRAGADGYDEALGRTKPAKGERAAVTQYLEPDETLLLRQPAEGVGEVDGRVLSEGGDIILVTDRKILFAHTSGGFRPGWEVFTLPFGHLEPGVQVGGDDNTNVDIPTSGRRAYRVQLADPESAARLASALADALGAYRRDRMGLDDA